VFLMVRFLVVFMAVVLSVGVQPVAAHRTRAMTPGVLALFCRIS
jgi:hypothetical protein